MPSTYSSNLKIELIATGDQSGTWGTTTNNNLGTLLEQSIVGYTTQALSGAGPTAITIPDGASGVARNYVLEFTGTPTANHVVTVPAVQKPYTLYNNTNTTIVVKVSGQTGVTVLSGKKAIVYNNGTDIIEVANAPVTEAGTQTLTNKTISNGTFSEGYTEEVNTANTGTAYTIDLASGTLQILTLTNNATFTFPTATAGKSFTLFLKQDATGGRVVIWPASVKWPNSTAPTITYTASKGDKYVFTADGTYWWGSVAGQTYL